MAVDTNCDQGRVPPLWRVLDLLLEAYAFAVECDPEVARFALMTILVVGERLELSDKVIDRMLRSSPPKRGACATAQILRPQPRRQESVAPDGGQDHRNDAAGRAGEGDPQLLVERRDRGNVARVVEADLVEARAS